MGFSVKTPQNLRNESGQNCYKKGAVLHTYTKNWGNHPWVLPKGAKTCFVFLTKITRPFGHVSCTDFDHF